MIISGYKFMKIIMQVISISTTKEAGEIQFELVMHLEIRSILIYHLGSHFYRVLNWDPDC